uniref:CSON001766 protein n=1 Tax=Culicoides sonorensis TaxID=179676 RepID=A0A336LRC7_CULSO
MLQELSIEQEFELIKWIETFPLSRPSKRLGRDFSDGVLLAEILKSVFPKLVDLHNYQPCNSIQQKINNWTTLERKILRKIDVELNESTISKLAEADAYVMKKVLYDVMKKIQIVKKVDRSDTSANDNPDSSNYLPYDNCDIIEGRVKELNEIIQILQQKNEHLENLLKLKDKRIFDLENRLKKHELE